MPPLVVVEAYAQRRQKSRGLAECCGLTVHQAMSFFFEACLRLLESVSCSGQIERSYERRSDFTIHWALFCEILGRKKEGFSNVLSLNSAEWVVAEFLRLQETRLSTHPFSNNILLPSHLNAGLVIICFQAHSSITVVINMPDYTFWVYQGLVPG